jgi:hypothetical protein
VSRPLQLLSVQIGYPKSVVFSLALKIDRDSDGGGADTESLKHLFSGGLKSEYTFNQSLKRSCACDGWVRRIGAPIAKRLAADGAAVALTFTSDKEKAQEVVRSIESSGGHALSIRADSRPCWQPSTVVPRAGGSNPHVFSDTDFKPAASGIRPSTYRLSS